MHYTTLTGRRFDLAALNSAERRFLRDILALFLQKPSWEEFAVAWSEMAQARLWPNGQVPVGNPVYRMCQDLAARRGIAEGKVARPDYRDQLADRIEERFGSRYRFCKETGIDPAHLSRVLAGRKHFAAETLLRVLEILELQLSVAEGDGSSDGAGYGPKPEELSRGPAENAAWLEHSEEMLKAVEAFLANARLNEQVGSHL